MSIHKIGVIADTHGLLRPEAAAALRECELILHCGDIGGRQVLERLREIAEVRTVRGNTDREAWCGELPKERCFSLYGKCIYMVHNKKECSEAVGQADMVIYGHSHKYECREEAGRLWLNPGSCGPARFRLPVTMAVLEIEPEAGTVEICKVELTGVKKEELLDRDHADLKPLIEAIMRDMQKNRTIEQMMKRHRIRRELAEEICQIYATHPGVTAQGILDRMEIAGR